MISESESDEFITLKPVFCYKPHFYQTSPDQFLLHQNQVTDFPILSELVVDFYIFMYEYDQSFFQYL